MWKTTYKNVEMTLVYIENVLNLQSSLKWTDIPFGLILCHELDSFRGKFLPLLQAGKMPRWIWFWIKKYPLRTGWLQWIIDSEYPACNSRSPFDLILLIKIQFFLHEKPCLCNEINRYWLFFLLNILSHYFYM